VMHLSISPSNRKLRVATHGSGVYQGDLLEETSVSTNQLNTGLFDELKVYPNPVVDHSNISFFLSEKTMTELSLYSAEGKKIRSLFTGTKESGTHELSFDFSDLPSTVYYYTLKAKAVNSKAQFVKSISFIKN